VVSSVPLTALAASVDASFTPATVSEAVTVTGVPPSDTTAVGCPRRGCSRWPGRSGSTGQD